MLQKQLRLASPRDAGNVQLRAWIKLAKATAKGFEAEDLKFVYSEDEKIIMPRVDITLEMHVRENVADFQSSCQPSYYSPCQGTFHGAVLQRCVGRSQLAADSEPAPYTPQQNGPAESACILTNIPVLNW